MNKKKNNIIFRIIILLIIISLSFSAFPQSSIYKHYSTDDGLPSSEVYHVFQDSKGFIWFGTNYGVSRFDGYHFKNFDTQSGLPDNTVLEIYEDYKGRLWFITLSLKLSYYENGKIYSYKHNDILQKNIIKTNPLYVKRCFHVDKDENVFCGDTRNGAFKISADGKVYKYNFNNSKEKGVHFYIKDNSRVITAFDKETLFSDSVYIVKDNKVFKTTNILSGIPDFNKTILFPRFISIFHNNTLFYTDRTFLLSTKDFKTWKYNRYNSEKDIVAFDIDRNNTIYLGFAKGGVLCYKNADITSTPKLLFDKQTITSVCEDHEGGLWFSTLDNGVFYLPSKDIFTYTKSDGLIDDRINCIEKDDSNNIWLGYNSNYIGVIKDTSIYNYSISQMKFTGATVINTLSVNNKSLYAGSSNYLIVFSGKSKEIDIKNMFIKSSITLSTSFIKILKGDSNNLWVGCGTGLLKMNDKNEITYSSSLEDKVSMRINGLYEEKDRSLWLGTLSGLWKFIPKKNENEKNKFLYCGDKNNLLKNRILDIQKNKIDNTLWLGTKGAGILIMNGEKILQLTETDGLASNTVASLCFDKNIVWAGTNKGISKIKITGESSKPYIIENYTKYDGLASNEIKQIVSDGDTLYLATDKGLTVLNKKKLKQNTVPPPIYITGIKFNDRDSVLKAEYTLPHNKNYINIKFVGLAFRNAGQLTYRYKMEGIDTSWKYTTNTSIQYTTLPPGSYRFLVGAMNNNGFWSTNSASIIFNINPPYWQTWWFRSIIILSFIGILIVIYLIRISVINRRNSLTQKLNQYMLQALGKQMNPHFIFNSLNSINTFILKNERFESSKYITKFASLMRLILNNSQHELVPLQDELQALEIYVELEAVRFKEKFDYKINVDERIDAEHFKIPPLLIQPYVENAIWHGLMHKSSAGSLLIEFKYEEKNHNRIVKCIIEDNGVGRGKAMEIKQEKKGGKNESLGTAITGKRLSILNSLNNMEMKLIYTDLKNEDGTACGTRVELLIPIPNV
ncbi:MAG: two-component regulator propeller domain-containing protein [Bacteroidales bacterium]|nr:two-component regulator propeller domain-containing protein [Bacteroidales bacterium]